MLFGLFDNQTRVGGVPSRIFLARRRPSACSSPRDSAPRGGERPRRLDLRHEPTERSLTMLQRFATRKSSRGYSLCQLLVVIGLIAILSGLMVRGGVWIRSQADIAVLTSHCEQFSTALQMYYQKHRKFPDAFPANLEQDLAPYIANEALFTCPANPAARSAPLNASYVTPVLGYEHAYILGLDTRYDEDVSVVLFSNSTTEIVEKLPAFHNEVPIILGNRATGGVVTFGSGSEVTLHNDTTVTVVNSFRSKDGTPFNVVKFDKGVGSSVRLRAIDTDIIQLVSYPGLVFLRGGIADAVETTGETRDELQVSTLSGEVRVIGRTIARAERRTEEEQGGEGGLAVSGSININPMNNAFRFLLMKPDGKSIDREDLLRSHCQFEYNGPISWVLLKPKGNGNQNSFCVNGEAYPLDNARLYLLIGSDIEVRLYNDRKLNATNAGMGRWWLDSITATNAYMIPLNWVEDGLPPEDTFEDYYDPDGTPVDDGTGTGDSAAEETEPNVLTGQTVRTLCRGFCVLQGQSITVARNR
jgi:type II secretory pathway pseudopilin PulG